MLDLIPNSSQTEDF